MSRIGKAPVTLPEKVEVGEVEAAPDDARNRRVRRLAPSMLPEAKQAELERRLPATRDENFRTNSLAR